MINTHLIRYTDDSLLTYTSITRTPRVGSFFNSFYLRQTLLLDGHFTPVATKVSVLERVCIYFLCEILIRPRQHVSFFIWKRRVFLPVWVVAHTINRWKPSPNTRIFSKNPLQSGDFWKRRCAVFVRMDENWGFEDDYVTLLDPVYPVHEIRQIRFRYQ